MITYPHHPGYIGRSIIGAVHSDFVKRVMKPNGEHNDEVSVMILKYNESSPFKYEVVVTGGLVLRFGGEFYPQLPDDVEVTLGMIDNYPHDDRKYDIAIMESWDTFCHPSRMNLWRTGHNGGQMIDNFIWSVGRLIETVVLGPTTLKVYSVRMKVEQLKEIERGYPRKQSESQGEAHPA